MEDRLLPLRNVGFCAARRGFLSTSLSRWLTSSTNFWISLILLRDRVFVEALDILRCIFSSSSFRALDKRYCMVFVSLADAFVVSVPGIAGYSMLDGFCLSSSIDLLDMVL